jgi:NADH:ubiquinone oxidoreductase subunit F (NADH-binding)
VRAASGRSAQPDVRQAGPSRTSRLLPPDGEPVHDLFAHVDRFGRLPYRGGQGLLIPDVDAAGLTGRGGAGFPTAAKLSAVLNARRRSVVVANGAEGEPASEKDKLLLWYSPHLVLDGLQLAAEAVGADRTYLYLPRLRLLTDQVQAALAARRSAGVDRLPVDLVGSPPRFLAGEESALVSRVDGGAALPRFRPPPVFQRGVGGRPTLVQNVETLAHLALIARYGPWWFRSVGTDSEPGTMLITRIASDGPGVAEAALGTPIPTVLPLDSARVGAVLVRGYHGTWLTPGQAVDLRLSRRSLKQFGATPAAGVLAALPVDRCGLAETARVVDYLVRESAGQCGPCLNGLASIAGAVRQLAEYGAPERIRTNVERWAGVVAGRGACKHPDGTVRFVGSALLVFAEEITLHQAGYCTATSREPFLPVPEGAPLQESDWR